ncbi:hypothetical protein RPHASCH2410_PD03900 (plasmid) [Rhizobium phaseoli Ch24-10]|nr:hypothetical protein RPHASCH2410_PD03900 [Rhizobium phaseoli Ch24-10]
MRICDNDFGNLNFIDTSFSKTSSTRSHGMRHHRQTNAFYLISPPDPTGMRDD